MYTQSNLKRMSRKDLLEILVLQSRKIDDLEEKLSKANELLETKQIMISEVGSIAEAAIKLNKVFEVAQQSADQYLENIKRIEAEQELLRLKLEKELSKKKATKKKKSKQAVKKKSKES